MVPLDHPVAKLANSPSVASLCVLCNWAFLGRMSSRPAPLVLDAELAKSLEACLMANKGLLDLHPIPADIPAMLGVLERVGGE